MNHTKSIKLLHLGWILPLAVITGKLAAAEAVSALTDGRFGKAVALKEGRKVIIPLSEEMDQFPVTFEFWFRLDSVPTYNILISKAPKTGPHWELFSSPGEGRLFLWIPQISQAENIGGSAPAVDSKWHFTAVCFEPSAVSLYLDGKLVIRREHKARFTFDSSPIYLGGIASEVLACDGAIDDLHIHRGTGNPASRVPDRPAEPGPATLHLFSFDEVAANGQVKDRAAGSARTAQVIDRFTRPTGGRFLDEVQDGAFNKSSLFGDQAVEDESQLPAHPVGAQSAQPAQTAAPAIISLSGEWLMKDCDARADRAGINRTPTDSPGLQAGWHKPGFDRSDWYKVRVPTSVQSALLKLGQIADPLFGSNTVAEMDKFGKPPEEGWQSKHTRIEQKDWWFARQFTVPQEWKGKPVRLYFDGIDYGGSVYLNGASLGYQVGMFGGPAREVGKLLNFGGENLLVVRVDKAPDHWTGRLKGSPGWGWHYGHLISIGLWRDVTLQLVPTVEMSAPYVATRKIHGETAELQVEYLVASSLPEPADVQVAGVVSGANFESKPVAFRNRLRVWPGKSRWRTTLRVPKARLWWPVNYGAQYLYRLALTPQVKGDGIAPPATCQTRFGIRTVEMLPAMGAIPESDYKWQFVINGHPMFIKGANWCWSDPMLECDPAKYEKILELARRGGIQMFRAWGGGIIETDTFYDKCDEKGLMVYQEFPFCWGPPDFPGTNPQMADQQISAVVKRNRNHPSLVMWGGGNENGFSKGNDEGLLLVGRRCRQYDPSRPFHRTDPWGGSAHNWSVFHNGAPMDESYYGFRSVFYGEYGLPSMPNRSSCLKFLPASELDQWPMDDTRYALLQHMNQFSSRDPIKVLKYADYGPIKDWNTYIEYSQMAQGDWLRFAAEGQRSCSGKDKTGFWFYKFTDLFPGHSWAVVDYYGSPKLSYYRAKQTCQPRCAFAVSKSLNWPAGEPFRATLHLANDTATTMGAARMTATIYASDLQALWSKEYQTQALAADERLELAQLKVLVPAERAKPFLLAVSLHDGSGKLVSDQWYWYNFRAKTEQVKEIEKLDSWRFPEKRFKDAYDAYAALPEAPLLNLPRTGLAITVKKVGSAGQLIIRNQGSLPAFNVLIDNYPDGYKDFLEDNSFCLRPGEERAIGFELGPGGSLDPVGVRAWNAAAVKPK